MNPGYLRTNHSGGLQYQTQQEMMVMAIFSLGSGVSFFYINCVLLYTLSSKAVFSETSRYILLYNLLFADATHLVLSLSLYLLAVCRVLLKIYVCGILTMLSILTEGMFPLTLAVMSMERYVSVCLPLRHTNIASLRNTGAAIATIWALCSLNVLVRVVILFSWNPAIQLNAELKDFCAKEALFIGPMSDQVDKGYSIVVFCLGGIAIMFSYVGVTLVARSASTDKASARKASKTLLLHLIQLVLAITSTLYSTILIAISTRTRDRLLLVRLYNIFYIFLILLPRCLSALIYGLRDQTIRTVFIKNLCGWLRCLVRPNKT